MSFSTVEETPQQKPLRLAYGLGFRFHFSSVEPLLYRSEQFV